MVLVKNSIPGRLSEDIFSILLFYLLNRDVKMRKPVSSLLVIFNVRPFKERDIEFCGCICAMRVTFVSLYVQSPYRPIPK